MAKDISVVAVVVFVFELFTDVNAEIEEKHHNETERYQLISVDFQRVGIPYIICLWILVVSLAKVGFHLHKKLPSVIPESCLLFILGIVLGATLRYSGNSVSAEQYALDSETFFIYLLPPIIFDAGYFMPVRSFFDNIGTILLLAIMNTVINTLLIGVSLYAVSYWGWISRSISLLSCLIFSSLISAVDPVAVLATFEEIHVNQMLYIIVFGESLLNDGVTVVLYHMMAGFIEIGEENLIPVDVITAIGSFFIIAVGGTIVGLVFGLFGGFITKYTHRIKIIEPMLVFVLGYMMYLSCEIVHLSGILALSFGGIALRHYLEGNVSKTTQTTIKYFMKMLSTLSETIIFMFLGLSAIVDEHDWNPGFILFALLFCLVYRVVGVIILSWVLNRRRLVQLTKVDQFVMAYGGLRGGIAFCLALSLDEKVIPERRLFITTTITIVFFSVFVQGISIKPVVNALKVKKADEIEPSLNEKIHERFLDHLMAGIEGITAHSGHNLMRSRFREFNGRYLKPIFSRDKPTTPATKLLKVFGQIRFQDDMVRAESFSISAYQSQQFSRNGSGVSLSNDEYEPHRTQLDSHINDIGYSNKMVDDSQLHHLLEANLFPTCRTWFAYSRNSFSSTPIRHRHASALHIPNSLAYTKSIKSPKANGVISQTVNDVDDKKDRSPCEEVVKAGSYHLTNPVPNSEFASVTINFPSHDSNYSENIGTKQRLPSPSPYNTQKTDAETLLPWKQQTQDPLPAVVSINLSNGSPQEMGLPYASPKVTVMPVSPGNMPSLFNVFPETRQIQTSNTNVDITLPPPCGSGAEEVPITSLPVIQSGDKNNYPENSHSFIPPSHHSIIPATQTTHDPVHSEDSDERVFSPHPGVTLSPNLPQHWQPIDKKQTLKTHLHSVSVPEQLSFQNEVQNQVKERLQSGSPHDNLHGDNERITPTLVTFGDNEFYSSDNDPELGEESIVKTKL